MAVLANQKILTLDYWKRADQVQEGDLILDRNGQPAKVTLIQKYTPPHCYEVQFNDHLTVAGDDKLEFVVENYNDRMKESQYKGIRPVVRQYQNKRLADLLEEPLYDPDYRQFAYSVPTTQPLQLPHQDLPVPPFIFGFWFFNRKKSKQMVAHQEFQDGVHEAFRDAGYQIRLRRYIKKLRYEFTITPTIESQLIPNIPTRIPNNYLMGSYEQRLELLKGILQSKTKQYNPRTKNFRITCINASLLRQVQWLVESLGHRTNWFSRNNGKDHRLMFKSYLHLLPNQPAPIKKRVLGRRAIVEIYEIAQQPCVHIETTGDRGTFLVGEGFISCL
jgi:preprotein translocase subunit YajC